MTIRIAVEHRTAYHFDRAVGIGAHTVRLRPAPHCRTPITGYSLQVSRRTTSATGSRTRTATSPGWCSPNPPPT